jgi:prevent-host-death family protein
LEERLSGTQKVAGSSPASSTPIDAPPGGSSIVGAHEFRNRFGWYMERAAAGEEFLVTRRGKPKVRLIPATPPA